MVCDVDDDQIMDVLEILADFLSMHVGVAIANDEIAGCAGVDFPSNMTREDKLSIAPGELNLYFSQISSLCEYNLLTRFS